MIQKIIKVGTSHAVVLPKRDMETMGVAAGDPVSVFLNTKKGVFEIAPKIKKVDLKALAWTQKFIEKYRSALEALAKK